MTVLRYTASFCAWFRMSSFDSNLSQESEDGRPGSSGSSTPTDILVFNVNKIEDVSARVERHMIEINGETISDESSRRRTLKVRPLLLLLSYELNFLAKRLLYVFANTSKMEI